MSDLPLTLLREVSAAAAARAIQQAPIPKQRPATVVTTSAGTEVAVLIDGDSLASIVQNITGEALLAGTRVMVQLWPPHGAFVVGAIQGATPTPEAWRIVGAAGQPAFVNSWANFGGAWTTAGFYRDALGWVHMRGLVASGSAANATIFTLPSGYRPPFTLNMSTVANAGVAAQLAITAAGVVAVVNNGSTVYQSLECVFPSADFYVESDWLPMQRWEGAWIQSTLGEHPLAWTRDDGWSWLAGLWTGGASGQVMATLPEAVLPGRYRRILAAYGNSGASVFARHDVRSDGYLDLAAGGSGTLAFLSGKHWIGNRGADLDWQAATLGASWTNFGGLYAPASYVLDDFGVVHLRGVITGGTTAISTVLFTLPVGYRPEASRMFLATTGGSASPLRLDVAANGDVVLGTAATSGFVSLDSVAFRGA